MFKKYIFFFWSRKNVNFCVNFIFATREYLRYFAGEIFANRHFGLKFAEFNFTNSQQIRKNFLSRKYLPQNISSPENLFPSGNRIGSSWICLWGITFTLHRGKGELQQLEGAAQVDFELLSVINDQYQQNDQLEHFI